MLERFLAAFRTTQGSVRAVEEARDGFRVQEVIGRLGGCTFDGGLYRVHTADTSRAAEALVAAAYPDLAHRMGHVFGYDWLGRQFAVDRGVPDEGAVVMFEPGTGEMLEIPVPMTAFHDEELVDFADAALAADFFHRWKELHSEEISGSACVGYRTPLYLGGVDDVANLELTDLEVYWTLMGQIRNQVRGLPPGTRVTGVRLAGEEQ